jgi:hypothetical protein
MRKNDEFYTKHSLSDSVESVEYHDDDDDDDATPGLGAAAAAAVEMACVSTTTDSTRTETGDTAVEEVVLVHNVII